MPYIGVFHFTALRTLGTFRTMSASSRRPTSRFQPGIAAMYACTGASPSPFAMRGLPPVRSFEDLALLAPRLALATGREFMGTSDGRETQPLAGERTVRKARTAC